MLEAEDIDVLVASDGAQALEMALHHRPNALLLDIHMPVMDGLEALARLKSHPELSAIPVMMLTSDSQAANVREALATGARDFVVKPFEPAELRSRVRRLLGLEVGAPLRRAVPPATHGRAGSSISRRVLLVARPAVLAVARSMLRGRHHVTATGSGAEALALRDDTAFDAAVIEMTLPDMPGTDVVLSLLRRPALAEMRTIALARTAGDAWDDRVFFTTVLSLPLIQSDLLAAIEGAGAPV